MKVKKQKPIKARKATIPYIPFNPYLPLKKTSLNLRKKKFSIETENATKNNAVLLRILKKIA